MTCDGSAFVGSWPFATTSDLSSAQLVDRYRRLQVVRGAVTPLPAILAPEPMTANLSFLRQVRAVAEAGTTIVPVPVINPTLPSCAHDLEVCLAAGAGAVKIFPGYHGYPLKDERVDVLAEDCEGRHLPLCIQVRMEDERSHNPVFQVPAVDVEAIRSLAQRHIDLIVLACGLYMGELPELSACGNVAVEMSFVEGGLLLAGALSALPAERIMLGTHVPLFVAESGLAKLASEPASAAEADALRSGTFTRVFGCPP